MPRLLLLLLSIACTVKAIPIDNGVIGGPEIECGPDSIDAFFNTQQLFDGHVYVKGRYHEEGCRTAERGRQSTGISLPFSSCGVVRERSLNPRGVFVTATVIITFHPQFITKVDRAFKLQCFYMEADKTVSTDIEVSPLTSEQQTQLVPMPVCQYQILDAPDGRPVQFVLVGDAVYHKWNCVSEFEDTFCMRVYACFVDDGQGEQVPLLDDRGCAIDRYLLQNLEYPTDLMAGQEAHVFKYADRSALYFQCQIEITVKEPGEQCPLPECVQPAAGRSRRGRRSPQSQSQLHGWLDVRSQALDAVDLSAVDDLRSVWQQNNIWHDASQHQRQDSAVVKLDKLGNYAACISATELKFVMSLCVLAGIATLGTAAALWLSRAPRRKTLDH